MSCIPAPVLTTNISRIWKNRSSVTSACFFLFLTPTGWFDATSVMPHDGTVPINGTHAAGCANTVENTRNATTPPRMQDIVVVRLCFDFPQRTKNDLERLMVLRNAPGQLKSYSKTLFLIRDVSNNDNIPKVDGQLISICAEPKTADKSAPFFFTCKNGFPLLVKPGQLFSSMAEYRNDRISCRDISCKLSNIRSQLRTLKINITTYY